jgi:preprotein translocase subunit Sss1
MRYIDINANFIPWGYPLTLEIHGPKFSDKEKTLIAKVLKNHYSLLLVNKKEELKDLRKRGLYLIIMGVVSFIIYLLLMYFKVNYAPIELMAFLFWLALWEGFDAEILSPDDIKDEIKDLEYLSNMNIIYEDEESDDII